MDNTVNSVQALKKQFEVRSQSATPRITITSTEQDKNIFNIPPDTNNWNEESDIQIEDNVSDTFDEEQHQNNNRELRSIKSVSNINVYANEESSDSHSSESEDSSDEESEEVLEANDSEEIIPHQLSVIFEESERGGSQRSFRPESH